MQCENTVVSGRQSDGSNTGGSATMPASVNETVTASLLLSLSTKCGPENGEIPLQQRMAAISKRALLEDIEYEVSDETYQTAVLQELKAKYADPEEKSIKNGSSSQSKCASASSSV